MQLHHKYDTKTHSAFNVRSLKGTELEKWARCQPDLDGNTSLGELRELQLLVSHGKFQNSNFIVAERSQQFIGKLRLRQTDEALLKLDPPVVLQGFDFYRVARALVEHAVRTLRADQRPCALAAPLDRTTDVRLHEVYEHLGFTVLEQTNNIAGSVYMLTL